MKKRIKKGFTLVELLVVIAILAILSTVAIVGYNSFTEKAKVSNDTALVKQLNTLLQADEAVDGKPVTPSEALEVVAESGYNVKKMTPTATDYNIIWNEETNKFVLLDDKDNEVVEELSEKAYKNWQFTNTYTQIKTGFSVYLNDGFEGTELTVNSGLDVGTNDELLVVNYVSNDTEEVTFVTNGGTFNVNNANATVNHYGSADVVNVIAVSSNTYNLFGHASFIEVADNQHVVIKTGASVNAVYANGTSNVEGTQNIYTEADGTLEDIKTGATSFAAGDGTENNPYQIALPEQFANISKITKSKAYYTLTNDLDMINVAAEDETAYVSSDAVNQNIILDLNGHIMTNVRYQLFRKVINIEVFDGTIEFYSSETDPKSLAVVNTLSYDGAVNASFHDLVLNGSIYSTSAHFGPVVMYGYSLNNFDSNIILENVISNVNITNQSTNAYSGGLVGYIGGTKASLTITNCEYNGTIISPYSAGFAGGCTSPKVNIVVDDNKLTGTVIGTNSAQPFGGNSNMIGGKTMLDSVNNSVINSGIVVKSINDSSLFQNSTELALGEEFVINHTYEAVAYYKVSYMYWVHLNDDIEAGRPSGYPRSFEVEIEVTDVVSYNTGIFKNKVVQSVTDRSTDANRIHDEETGNGCVVWQEGDTYYIYSTRFTLVDTMNSNVYIYGYNSNNSPVVFAQYSFNLNK